MEVNFKLYGQLMFSWIKTLPFVFLTCAYTQFIAFCTCIYTICIVLRSTCMYTIFIVFLHKYTEFIILLYVYTQYLTFTEHLNSPPVFSLFCVA